MDDVSMDGKHDAEGPWLSPLLLSHLSFSCLGLVQTSWEFRHCSFSDRELWKLVDQKSGMKQVVPYADYMIHSKARQMTPSHPFWSGHI